MSHVYLYGEQHDDLQEIPREKKILEDLLEEDPDLNALSLELDYPTYQPSLQSEETLKELRGDPWYPLMQYALDRGLDLLASDYRDTPSSHIVANIADEDTQQSSLQFHDIVSEALDEDIESMYTDDTPNEIKSLSDTVRRKFMKNQITTYLRSHQGSHLFHIGGEQHISPLKKMLEREQYEATRVSHNQCIS